MFLSLSIPLWDSLGTNERRSPPFAGDIWMSQLASSSQLGNVLTRKSSCCAEVAFQIPWLNQPIRSKEHFLRPGVGKAETLHTPVKDHDLR